MCNVCRRHSLFFRLPHKRARLAAGSKTSVSTEECKRMLLSRSHEKQPHSQIWEADGTVKY